MNRWKNMTPFRTALTYAVFSALWTSFSDDALEFLVPRYSLNYDLMNTLNDWLFVFASAVLVYFMLRSELKSLHASEEKFKYIFDYSAVGKTITSPDGVITANKAFREMLGYSEEELVGEKWQEITYPDDIAPSMQVSEMLIKGEKNSAQFTKRYLHKNGSVVWVNLNTSLRRNEAGEPMYFMTSVLDITERKQAEERIQELLEFNEKIVETSPIGILTYKLSGECVFANQNAAFITGASVEMLQTENFHTIESWKTSGLYDLVEKAIANKVAVMSDIHHITTFGKEIWLTVHATTFKSKDEDQLLLTISDITKRKEADKKLAEQNLRLITLREIDTAILASDSVENIVGAALDHIRELIDCERANLALIDWEKNEAVNFDVRDTKESAISKGARVSLDLIQGILHVLSQNQPVLMKDLTLLPDPPSQVKIFIEEGLRSRCILPLLSQGKLIGSFTLASKTPDYFDNEKINLGREVANQVVIAISQSRLVESLRKSEEQYRGLFEHMAEGYSYCQMLYENGQPQDWVYISVNEAFETLTGLKDVIGKRASEVTPGLHESDPKLFEIYSRVALSGEHEKFEMFIEVLQMWFSVSVYSPEKEFFVAMFDVITERKQAEEALQKSELIFRSFLEQSVDAILIANNKGEVIQWSKGAEQLTGFSPEETVGRLIWDVQFRSAPEEYKSTENYEHLKATLQEVFSTGKAKILNHFGEAVLRRPDGSYVTAQTLAFSIQTGHEFLLGNIMRDITEHKHAEKIIHQYATELEQRVKDRTAELTYANHVKDEFLANMSHELRTPLNSILGLSETLLEQRRGSLNESQQKSLQTIEASGSHLLNLINDILDLSKVDAGKFDYYPQSLSLNEVCRSSLSFVRDQAAKKSINLQYTNEASVPSIYADPRRLKQILVNLLTNAVKFTPAHGQVTLEVHAQVEHKLIQISIIDTGIGIAAEDLKRLFTPFVQLDSSLNRQFEGTGLGLALAQKLTDLHGGSLEVESEVGKGSRFTVNLMMYEFGPEEQLLNAQVDGPWKVNQPVIRADSLSNHFELKNKILLAEDNEANILTVSEYLESHGYQILVAHDGVEAIAKAEADNPDVILMDVQMPNMNGLEATRRLRADPRFTATPIVALTALAMVGDRERCLEAGATEYLSKPVSLQALRQMIEAFLIQKMKMKLKLP